MRRDSIQGTGRLACRNQSGSSSLSAWDAGGDVVKRLFQLFHLVSAVGSKPINSWRSCRVNSKCKIGIQERARGNELGKQRLMRVPMVLTGVSLK